MTGRWEVMKKGIIVITFHLLMRVRVVRLLFIEILINDAGVIIVHFHKPPISITVSVSQDYDLGFHRKFPK